MVWKLKIIVSILETAISGCKKEITTTPYFNIKKAVALYPSGFEANYRLAIGYGYQYQYDFENCKTGMQLIQKLEKAFPGNQDIHDVKAIFVHWEEQ